MARKQTSEDVAAARRRQAARRKAGKTTSGLSKRRAELRAVRGVLRDAQRGGISGSALRTLQTRVRRAERNVAAQEAEQARRRRKAGS